MLPFADKGIMILSLPITNFYFFVDRKQKPNKRKEDLNFTHGCLMKKQRKGNAGNKILTKYLFLFIKYPNVKLIFKKSRNW